MLGNEQGGPPRQRSRPDDPPPPSRKVTPILADPGGVVAAELLALRRGDPDVCGCCTSHEDRRPALDRLRDESHRLGIAGWAHTLMPLGQYYRQRGRVA